MKCNFCGKEIPDDSAFCPECGKSLNPIPGFKYDPSQMTEPDPDFVVVDPQKDKNMAIVAYITWIGFIIAMVSDSKNSTFTKFHLNQALILNIASIVCPFIPLVGALLGIAVFVFWIMALISAVNGEMKSLPLIENIKIIQ
jgi:uncharacterized membrane protein